MVRSSRLLLAWPDFSPEAARLGDRPRLRRVSEMASEAAGHGEARHAAKPLIAATHGGKDHHPDYRKLQLVEATQVPARSGFSPETATAGRVAIPIHAAFSGLWC